MFLKIAFEIILLAILIGGAYYGIRLGFIRIAAKPIKLILGIAFAFTLCGTVGREIITPLIQAPTTNYIKEHLYESCASLTPEAALEKIPTVLKMAGAAFNVDVAASSAESTDALIERVVVSLTSPAVVLISVVIAFILLFLLSKLLFSAAVCVVSSVFEIGVLAKINRALGFVLAGLMSFFLAWAFVSIVDFFFHLSIFDTVEFVRAFEGGPLYRLFISISPIGLLLSF